MRSVPLAGARGLHYLEVGVSAHGLVQGQRRKSLSLANLEGVAPEGHGRLFHQGSRSLADVARSKGSSDTSPRGKSGNPRERSR